MHRPQPWFFVVYNLAELVAKKEEAVVVSRCQDKKKLVTALAVSEDPDGQPFLYSGHDDGTVTKWNLQDNKKIWSKQIYPDESEEEEGRFRYSFSVSYTTGVAGLVVRPDPSRKGRHLLYTWTNGEGDETPHSLKVWSGTDGSFVREHICHLGNDDEGQEACPDITTVVFCPLLLQGKLVDSVIVGFHCLCSALDYGESYTNFSLVASEKHSEGNILPFYEHPTDGTGSMESWRGHRGMIQAMAVVHDRFLLSYSIQPGHGFPDAMILWNLHEPGVPLFRKDLWDPSKNIYKQSRTRLLSVCGISVQGCDILLADEHGRRVATVKVKKEGSFSLEGYAQTGRVGDEAGSFHGRMAMSKSFAAVANEGDSTVWIYKIEGNAEHPKLDRGDGDRRVFKDSESGPEKWTGREIAVAKVEIPEFGGNTPSSKKQKRNHQVGGVFMLRPLSEQPKDDGLGHGGPITLAIGGRNLITGFSNGTITNTTLPEKFSEESEEIVSANHLASCASLRSSEWYRPMLGCLE